MATPSDQSADPPPDTAGAAKGTPDAATGAATGAATIEELSRVLEARKNADPGSSYVAALYDKGLNKILEKIGEEATEVVLASRDLAHGTPPPSPNTVTDEATRAVEPLESALVGEVADLWFHSMVMLTHQGISPGKVLDELAKRFGVSGIAEKNSRTQ